MSTRSNSLMEHLKTLSTVTTRLESYGIYIQLTATSIQLTFKKVQCKEEQQSVLNNFVYAYNNASSV